MAREHDQFLAEVERGRAHFERRQWADAFEALLRAQRAGPLEAADLHRLVWCAGLVGDDDAFLRALERLHQTCLDAGNRLQAARAAFWIGFRLLMMGVPARATGWLARAERYVADEGDDCVERGYLRLPAILRQLGTDDAAAAVQAGEAATIGERCGDADLVAIARNLQGRALLQQGHTERGLALLDEVMVGVMSGDLSPTVTGIIYCNVIACCQRVYALDRAREWTAAFTEWCEQQPQLVTFTGNCLVHRSEIMQLAGDWPAALEEVRRICERERREADPAVFASACYQRAELFRLRGESVAAEAMYRLASEHGRDPQPGLALLRLAQGRQDEAVHAINRVVATLPRGWQRAHLLPAQVEILQAVGRHDEARAAADELTALADEFGTEVLGAIAAYARGLVLLAGGEAQPAIAALRHAFEVWQRAGAPYLAARVRVLLGQAYRELGDLDGATLELDAARAVFAQLGAAVDLAALPSLPPPQADPRGAPHGLSARELEVLRLLATGRTNRSIATELALSERTVERHVSNIFTKIDVSSRAAATAFAYQSNLV